MDSKTSVLAGRIMSGLVVVALLADGAINLFKPGLMAAEMQATGFDVALAAPLGIICLVCAALYASPKTAVLGAILITGFLGGAICTHFRIGEMGSPPQIICLVLGVLTWGGLYLRDARIRTLLPLVR